MNKEQYIRELRGRLVGVQEEEVLDAIKYCEEYFDEAGEGNEEQVMNDLGSPAKFSAQFKAESAIRRQRNPQERPKSSLNAIVLVLIGICALPLALPLLLTCIILIVTFILVIIAFVIASIAAIGAILLCGLPLIILGITQVGTPQNALVAIGGGLVSIGFGVLLLLLFVKLIKIFIPFTMHLVMKVYDKAKGGTRYEKNN